MACTIYVCRTSLDVHVLAGARVDRFLCIGNAFQKITTFECVGVLRV